MRHVQPRQLRLPFQRDPGQTTLPEPVRQKCRELLSQLLIKILTIDLQNKEKPDEREDNPQPP